MKVSQYHPIKYVASRTGLKAHNIRSWEERYGAVKPARSQTNRRLYSDRDIERLALLKKAVEGGHTISSVARLSDSELSKIVQDDHLSRPASADRTTGEAQTENGAEVDEDCRVIVRQALSHVVKLDALALEKVLNDAAVALPRQAFLHRIIVPLFVEIGSLWQSGRMKIINEHMASVIVRATLWDMLRTVEPSASAPRIVTATPTGHWHEFGALATALVAAEAGWQPCYFGPNLPAEEIAYAVKKTNASALALSLSHQLNLHKTLQEFRKIRRLVDNKMPIIVGGSGADDRFAKDQSVKAVLVFSLEKLRNYIDGLSKEKEEKM
ncbi:MAG: MerR family transcriptional regulator [Desulfobacterales bacterium]|nr:MerR family transcriptional regulator [Desulfobacterales bacterium]